MTAKKTRPRFALADYLGVADLEQIGLSPADVRQECPWAVELVALDDSPCWLAEDLSSMFGEAGMGSET